MAKEKEKPEMEVVRVKYAVTFVADMLVKKGATPEEIGEELVNLNIPEDEYSKYDEDSFEPVADEVSGDAVIYERRDATPEDIEKLGSDE